MKSTTQKMILFMAIYLLCYTAFSIATTQYIPYLTSLGFTATQRGILLSSIAGTTIIFQLIVGYLSDKFKTVKKFFILGMMAFAFVIMLLYRSEGKSFIYVFLMLSMSGGCFNLLLGVSDNWVLEIDDHVGRYFSVIRAFGSLGWAVGSALIALIIEHLGFVGLSNTASFIALIILGISLLLPDAQKAHVKSEEVKLDDVKVLLSNKKYRILLVMLFLIFSLNVFNTYTVTDKLISLNATTSQLGLKWSIAAIVEIPMFFAGVYLFQNFKASTLMMVATLAYIVQFLIFSFVQDPAILVYASAFQILTYPMALMASKHLVIECSSIKLRSTAQLVAMSVYNGIPALIMPVLSGWMIQTFHVDIALLSGVVLAVVAGLLIPVYQKN